jgi:hypothetical protein
MDIRSERRVHIAQLLQGMAHVDLKKRHCGMMIQDGGTGRRYRHNRRLSM